MHRVASRAGGLAPGGHCLGEECPEGAFWGLPGAGRVRRPVFRVVGTGARWVGGGAATLLLLFPRMVGAAGDECGGARPKPASGVSSSVPAFLSLVSRSRCLRPPGAFELSRPLDNQLASWPDRAGIVLHPYVPKTLPISWVGPSADRSTPRPSRPQVLRPSPPQHAPAQPTAACFGPARRGMLRPSPPRHASAQKPPVREALTASAGPLMMTGLERSNYVAEPGAAGRRTGDPAWRAAPYGQRDGRVNRAWAGSGWSGTTSRDRTTRRR